MRKKWKVSVCLSLHFALGETRRVFCFFPKQSAGFPSSPSLTTAESKDTDFLSVSLKIDNETVYRLQNICFQCQLFTSTRQNISTQLEISSENLNDVVTYSHFKMAGSKTHVKII